MWLHDRSGLSVVAISCNFSGTFALSFRYFGVRTEDETPRLAGFSLCSLGSMGAKSDDQQPDVTAHSATCPDAAEQRRVSTTQVGQTTTRPLPPHVLSDPPVARLTVSHPSSPPTIAEIQRLAGGGVPGLRYQEVREIAVSSTSVVSEAFDWQTRRRVALKRLRSELVDTDIAGRFRRERLIASWLDHPNILPVYDFIESDSGAPALVMKYIQGRTLAAEIRESKGDLSSIYKLLLVLTKVADAIQFAHDSGVVHGDLKPQNIMVGTRGEAYVMDWGIARFTPEVERELSSLLADARIPLGAESCPGLYGTPAYIAPEQVQATGLIDARTDVFGLGAILYQILAGVSPYEGAQVPAILEKATRAEITAPRKRSLRRPVRPDLDALCMKALARNPEERFQSAAQFVEALRTAMVSGSWFGLRTYQTGDVIVAQGEPSNEAFLIERGKCEVTQQTPSGESVFVRVLGPGDAFGETGVFTDSPRTASVVALDRVQVQCIDRQSLQWAMDEGGPLGVLVRALANRFVERERELYSLLPGSRQV